MSHLESIPFLTDDGKEVRFFILEQTMVGGVNYLLVSEDGDAGPEDADDTVVYIMKETGGAEGVAAYEFLEDETELASVSQIFEQLMEDMDIEVD